MYYDFKKSKNLENSDFKESYKWKVDEMYYYTTRQEKWYKDISNGNISIKEQIYTLNNSDKSK